MFGEVIFFNRNLGHGFISGEDGQSYFVAFFDIISDEKYKYLTKGEKVFFDAIMTEKGPKAIKVKQIKE